MVHIDHGNPVKAVRFELVPPVISSLLWWLHDLSPREARELRLQKVHPCSKSVRCGCPLPPGSIGVAVREACPQFGFDHRPVLEGPQHFESSSYSNKGANETENENVTSDYDLQRDDGRWSREPERARHWGPSSADSSASDEVPETIAPAGRKRRSRKRCGTIESRKQERPLQQQSVAPVLDSPPGLGRDDDAAQESTDLRCNEIDNEDELDSCAQRLAEAYQVMISKSEERDDQEMAELRTQLAATQAMAQAMEAAATQRTAQMEVLTATTAALQAQMETLTTAQTQIATQTAQFLANEAEVNSKIAALSESMLQGTKESDEQGDDLAQEGIDAGDQGCDSNDESDPDAADSEYETLCGLLRREYGKQDVGLLHSDYGQAASKYVCSKEKVANANYEAMMELKRQEAEASTASIEDQTTAAPHDSLHEGNVSDDQGDHLAQDGADLSDLGSSHYETDSEDEYCNHVFGDLNWSGLLRREYGQQIEKAAKQPVQRPGPSAADRPNCYDHRIGTAAMLTYLHTLVSLLPSAEAKDPDLLLQEFQAFATAVLGLVRLCFLGDGSLEFPQVLQFVERFIRMSDWGRQLEFAVRKLRVLLRDISGYLVSIASIPEDESSAEFRSASNCLSLHCGTREIVIYHPEYGPDAHPVWRWLHTGMFPGSRVRIRGLTATVHLNQHIGIVNGHEQNGRLGVYVPRMQKDYAIKIANLQLAPANASDTPDGESFSLADLEHELWLDYSCLNGCDRQRESDSDDAG